MYTHELELVKTLVKLSFKIFLRFSFWLCAFFYCFTHCILVCSCVYIPTPYQAWGFKFIPVKKKIAVCWCGTSIPPQNHPFCATFQLLGACFVVFQTSTVQRLLYNEIHHQYLQTSCDNGLSTVPGTAAETKSKVSGMWIEGIICWLSDSMCWVLKKVQNMLKFSDTCDKYLDVHLLILNLLCLVLFWNIWYLTWGTRFRFLQRFSATAELEKKVKKQNAAIFPVYVHMHARTCNP